MAQEHKGVCPAVGVPQLVRRDVAGKQHVPRGGVHGLPHRVGEAALPCPAKPDKPHLRHPPGQLGKLGQTFAGRPVPHRDDALLAFRQAVPLPEPGPGGGVGPEKPGVDAVGEGVDGPADLIPGQHPAGVDAGGDHQVPLAVAQSQPPAHQRRHQPGPPPGSLGGAVAIVHHLAAPGMGPGRSQQGPGAGGVEMHHAGPGFRPRGRNLLHQRQAGLFQGRSLVFQRTPHPAGPDLIGPALINADRHSTTPLFRFGFSFLFLFRLGHSPAAAGIFSQRRRRAS